MLDVSQKENKNTNNKKVSILVSQPLPKGGVESTPYHRLMEKYNIRVDFRSFIKVEPITKEEFEKQNIEFSVFTAVIFTSRHAVDFFFQMCSAINYEIPSDMKYYCISNQTANYLQKYIVVRKRKVFIGVRTSADLIEVLKKHRNEHFIFPCSDIRKKDIPNFLNSESYNYQEAVLYRTLQSDLSDLENVNYDIIAFFSPSGIKSLFSNFPDFKQKDTRIAAFGPTTAKAVEDAGLKMNIQAPLPNAPSMAGALEVYIREMFN